jgi:hypothetical protein
LAGLPLLFVIRCAVWRSVYAAAAAGFFPGGTETLSGSNFALKNSENPLFIAIFAVNMPLPCVF